MNVLSTEKTERQYATQRLSDGSDRQEIVETAYTVKVVDNNKIYISTFDHEPTEQEIADSITNGQAIESNDLLDKILLKQIQQEEMIEILTMMLLEKEGVL